MNLFRRVERARASFLAVVAFATLIATMSGEAATSAAAATKATPTETATFSGGCFWSMNAVFERIAGVRQVTAGFAGGSVPKPSYERVSTGSTGHAETVQIVFDPAVISYRDLLGIFFEFHDPTTLNRQGADVGEQYRSVIFWHSPEQRAAAQQAIAELESRRAYRSAIVTQLQPYREFYAAEDYHQNYYDKHSSDGYCRLVIAPKLEKLHKLHPNQLKAAM